MGNWQIAPGSFAVSSKPGSHGVRIALDATIRYQSTNDHAVSGRAGQNNPHRGGRDSKRKSIREQTRTGDAEEQDHRGGKDMGARDHRQSDGLWNLDMNFIEESPSVHVHEHPWNLSYSSLPLSSLLPLQSSLLC